MKTRYPMLGLKIKLASRGESRLRDVLRELRRLPRSSLADHDQNLKCEIQSFLSFDIDLGVGSAEEDVGVEEEDNCINCYKICPNEKNYASLTDVLVLLNEFKWEN